MDAIDRRLIEMLNSDGRRANVDMARVLGVSEGTVRKRIDRLIAGGLLHITGVVDPHSAGYGTRAWVCLTTELARVDDVARQLAAMPEVLAVQTVMGGYDIVAEVALRTNEDLRAFLSERVARLPGVLASKTHHVASTFKRASQWCPPPPPPPRVLVVDDDPDFIEFARLILTREGYRVDGVTSGNAALAYMAATRPDLVVMDVMMEGVLDGWDAAYRVRADKSLRDIPILVVSAITSSDYLSMLPTDDDNMIDGFISKPVQPQAFANEVTRLLSR
ncbi:MAG: response regulator [Chloroflexi bacterium]|nr:response regulator [Chloroflexota bacterium]